MLNDTHLMVTKINYSRDTKQQSQGSVLIKNIGDGVPSIWRFLDIIQTCMYKLPQEFLKDVRH